MATKKAAKTKQAGHKGTQKRNAGKTARAKDTTPVNARRVGAKTLAATIYARGGDFWDKVVGNVERIQQAGAHAAARMTQVMPRENGSAGATH